MKQKVLIAGGTGNVGKRLCEWLSPNYDVAILSRSHKEDPRIRTYQWNVKDGQIDDKAFENTKYVINLCGAHILSQRWSSDRKEEIIESRIQPAQVLRKYLMKNRHQVEAYISASAIGIYDTTKGEDQTEESPAGSGFLADVCMAWEKEAAMFSDLSIRQVSIRIGFVLSNTQGNAFHSLAQSVKYFVGAAVGNGKQMISWIHIDDLCRLFEFALKSDDLNGAINATAPNPVSLNKLISSVAEETKRSLWLPNIPKFILQTILGERADLLLQSISVLPKRALQKQFAFSYPTVDIAVKDLLN